MISDHRGEKNLRAVFDHTEHLLLRAPEYMGLFNIAHNVVPVWEVR